MYARNTFPGKASNTCFLIDKKSYMTYAVVYPKSSFSSQCNVA